MACQLWNRLSVACWVAVAAVVGPCWAQEEGAEPRSASISVDVAAPGVAIPPHFGGLMTEEINHAYDGGLFAELIRNRTFQDSAGSPVHWSAVGGGELSLDRSMPVSAALPVSLAVKLNGGTGGVANDGYWGIPIRPNTTYTASFYARGGDGFAGPVKASLVLDDGDAEVARAQSAPVSDGWRKYTLTITTREDAPTTAKAKFVLSASGSGSVSFSLVSLFPPTYQDVPGGLRPDLMKLMADLRPAFIRLPGGNYLEGDEFASRFDWKKMIGPAEQRPGHMGCWGYRSSDGFGLPQYLLWCKQLNAEPVLAVFAGYVLRHHQVNAGSPEMAQYTREALQEIEYVSGPADSEWGRRRAADGLAEPFPLHYVEIGNEDWFDASGSYDGRFTEIARAIRAKYPALKLIATAPVKSFTPDFYDDHYYQSARDMAADSDHYAASNDSPLEYQGGRWSRAQRGGPKTFVGEWATQEGRPTPDLNAALADAAWVMGLERSADVVRMECYAPLLVNVNPGAWQWPTNLIGYDALHSFGSPSYYAQVMLAQNRGDNVLPTTLKLAPTAAVAEVAPHGAVGLGTWHTQVEYKDISVTAPDGSTLLTADLASDTRGWTFTGDKWNLQDRVLLPEVADSECWAVKGDPKWTDYTLHVKARKTGGREGFLVLYHVVDSENYRWWNVGGWGNTKTQCEVTRGEGGRTPFGPASDFKVEANHWYDLRVEVSGRSVKCYADGRLITETTEPKEKPNPLVFASAVSAKNGSQVVLRVVNMGTAPVDAAIDLAGAGDVSAAGPALVLAGAPRAVNTVEEPVKVAPREQAVEGVGSSFRHRFGPYSLTVMRLNVARQ